MRQMKESGLPWIGIIPNTWNTHPVYYYFMEHKHKNHIGIEQNLLSLSYGNIIRKDINTNEGLLPENFNSYNIVKNGDIVLRLTDLQNDKKSLRTGLVKERGIITSAYVTLRPIKELSSTYFHYLLHAYDVSKVLYNMGSGVRQGLNYEELCKLMLIEPPLDEQKRIADFLDAKCIEIDNLIADIEKQIESLEQYKRSTIAEAVTKGLNPKAELKDIGFEWIGCTPASWRFIKGKYMFAQRNSKGNNICLQLLSPSQKFGVIPQSLLEELTTQNVVKLKDDTNLSAFKTIHVGDFCISLRSFQGGFEYCRYEGVVSSAYQVFYPTIKVCDDYYRFLFKDKGFIEKMNSYTISFRDGKNIAFSDFGNTYIPYPPLEEQKEIANYLDKQCAEINECIAQKEKQIETLQTYKKSLIFEYVTGKKEVV